jgi:hypothetical protein
MEAQFNMVSEKQLKLREETIRFVRTHTELFRQAGRTLDEDYGEQAQPYRPCLPKGVVREQNRADKIIESPPPRTCYSLPERFLMALHDILEDPRQCHALRGEDAQKLAALQLLVAWLRWDHDRDTVPRVTHFQDLCTANDLDLDDESFEKEDSQASDALLIDCDDPMDDLDPAWFKTIGKALRTLRALAGGAPNGSNNGGTPAKNPRGNGMLWKQAQAKAEGHVKAHNGAFPSVKRIAEAVGCSRPTMDKAIANSSYLKARKAEAEAARTPRREVSMPDAMADATAQQREREPLDELIDQQASDMARDERQAQAARHRRC